MTQYDASQSTPPPMSPQYAGGGPTAEDPGRTLGIVGLVLAFVASVIGLVISIIARRKSSRAGYKNGLALAGIIVGIITTLITIGIITATVYGIMHVSSQCKTLGSGTHQVNGVTYTCP